MWCWPSLPALLSLSACLAVGGACKGCKKKKKKPKGWTNIDTNSLCEWRCTNLWVIQSWNSREWINWTLKGLQRGGLNGQTVGHDRETGFFFNALQESGIQARPWMHHHRRASSEVSTSCVISGSRCTPLAKSLLWCSKSYGDEMLAENWNADFVYRFINWTSVKVTAEGS